MPVECKFVFFQLISLGVVYFECYATTHCIDCDLKMSDDQSNVLVSTSVCIQTEEPDGRALAVTSWVTDPSQAKSLLQAISDMNYHCSISLIKCKAGL